MKRGANTGIINNIYKYLNKDILLDMFRRICLVRYFELNVVNAVNDGFITYPIYLSLGQETIAAASSLAIPEFMIFTQHRCHGIYLAFGGDPAKLRDELMGLPTGTSGGRAGSNCIQCHENNIAMYGHHGLIGENVPLGVGAALGSRKPVVCFFGDGAAEEDYICPSLGFSVTHNLPVLFVCEDNNLSILTTVETRRKWNITDIAESFGMNTYEIGDDPWTIFIKIMELKNNLPAFINIHTCRSHWHVGVGTDGPPDWERFNMVKEELCKSGFHKEIKNIEDNIKILMGELWNKELLRTLSGK